MSNDVIKGSEYIYKIDKTHGLSSDGYIATGTESIVYKGVKISNDGKIRLACVLKFKFKSIIVGSGEDGYKTFDVLDRFKNNDLKIFNELQDCRSVVRIYDIIEDLGDFAVIDNHVSEGLEPILITGKDFFCVIEEFVDGWSLEEYCRDYYWKLTEEVDVGNNLKKKIGFHDFPKKHQQEIVKSYYSDYDAIIRYQGEMYSYMIRLCEILDYIAKEHRILHLDIKPDNIMITKYGKEVVLIDFGRSEYMSSDGHVKKDMPPADYSSTERIDRMFQYGTLGYAAPEAYAPAFIESSYPFDRSKYQMGNISIESDIFSFGATFWECLNIFELYTGCKEFAKDKSLGGSYDFYKKYMLNDRAYFNRDLSLTSPHYHDKLEQIILKCTRRRNNDYDGDSEDFYHSYGELKEDIEIARDSSPAIVKVENVKTRNAFALFGAMLGALLTLFILVTVLRLESVSIADKKLDAIMANYNATRIETLRDAANERIKASTERQKENIYKDIYDFLLSQNKQLDALEVSVLVDILEECSNKNFQNDAVDNIMKNTDIGDLSSISDCITTGLELDSIGYQYAKSIYNVQNKKELFGVYEFMLSRADDKEFVQIREQLIKMINHDDIVSAISEESDLSKNEIKIILENGGREAEE